MPRISNAKSASVTDDHLAVSSGVRRPTIKRFHSGKFDSRRNILPHSAPSTPLDIRTDKVREKRLHIRASVTEREAGKDVLPSWAKGGARSRAGSQDSGGPNSAPNSNDSVTTAFLSQIRPKSTPTLPMIAAEADKRARMKVPRSDETSGVATTPFLRHRSRTAGHEQEIPHGLDDSSWHGEPSGRRRSARKNLYSKSESIRKLQKFNAFGTLQNNYWNLFQIGVLLFVVFLLIDSHSRASSIASEIAEFKAQESVMFLHLHRIQEQSIQLHESMQRLNDKHTDEAGEEAPDNEKLNGSQNGHKGNMRGTPLLDETLIHKQTQQLLQMEEEISHEVRNLKTRIQRSAVDSIVQEYGEGPVQISMEVQFEGDVTRSTITFLLWHDTPHAAWTILEQISRGIWRGANFELQSSRILALNPINADKDVHLDFVEESKETHSPYTIGLTDNPSTGGLELFINLQDNTEFSKHNVCIGEVLEGFRTVRRIVDLSENVSKGGKAPNVSILSMRASHLHRKGVQARSKGRGK